MKGFFNRAPKVKTTPNYLFIIMVFSLIMFGLVMLSSASSDIAKIQFGDSYHYIKHQILYGLSFGALGFILTFSLYYERLRKIALILFILNIIALILVFTPLGLEAKGSSRWLEIGSFSFQPGELLKLTSVIYLASWLSKNKKRKKSIKEGVLPFLAITGISSLLLIFQPATTIAVILFVASLIMYFMSGAKIRLVLLSFLIAVSVMGLVVCTSPYRFSRIKTFVFPSTGDNFHINQSKLAIGSGRITGVGYGESTTKLTYLPEPIGDSIFAVIGEELGFIGTIIILLSFIVITKSGFSIAKKTSSSFGRLLVVGFISIIAIQAIINIGAISGSFPMTGVPLPFISYGGTSLAVLMTMSGIIMNVSKYSK